MPTGRARNISSIVNRTNNCGGNKKAGLAPTTNGTVLKITNSVSRGVSRKISRSFPSAYFCPFDYSNNPGGQCSGGVGKMQTVGCKNTGVCQSGIVKTWSNRFGYSILREVKTNGPPLDKGTSEVEEVVFFRYNNDNTFTYTSMWKNVYESQLEESTWDVVDCNTIRLRGSSENIEYVMDPVTGALLCHKGYNADSSGEDIISKPFMGPIQPIPCLDDPSAIQTAPIKSFKLPEADEKWVALYTTSKVFIGLGVLGESGNTGDWYLFTMTLPVLQVGYYRYTKSPTADNILERGGRWDSRAMAQGIPAHSTMSLDNNGVLSVGTGIVGVFLSCLNQ